MSPSPSDGRGNNRELASAGGRGHTCVMTDSAALTPSTVRPATLATPATPATIDRVVADLAFNEAGLVAAVAQRHDSGEVLMLAWMNADAVRETLTTGRVCYWSRSRQAPWRKGESSGHVQRLVAFRYDCDRDAVLLLVEQTGPACHTNRPSCFYREVTGGDVVAISEPVDT